MFVIVFIISLIYMRAMATSLPERWSNGKEGETMSRKAVHNIGQVIFYLFVILFVGIIILPFLWQFLTSIKPLSEISATPGKMDSKRDKCSVLF